RIERRQVVEENLFARLIGRFKVDRLDLDEREITLALFRRSDLTGDRVASAQIEFAYLRWADVDVVGPRQIVVFGRAQETKAVGQGFQDTFGEDQAALFGLRREHFKDQLLFAHARRAGH